MKAMVQQETGRYLNSIVSLDRKDHRRFGF
jgi:hypothetical protein